jgi:hypothetical protein
LPPNQPLCARFASENDLMPVDRGSEGGLIRTESLRAFEQQNAVTEVSGA